MDNREIARVFFGIADILEMQNVQWKPRAYRAAANAIESMQKPAAEIYKEGGIKALEEIPGVGEAIAKKMEEMIKTGRLKYYEELKKSLPIKIEELEKVPGLGPKRLMVLYKQLGIKNLADLSKAAQQHKISSLKGFGEKSEQEILKAIEEKSQKDGRVPLAAALAAANKIIIKLKKIKGVEMVEAAGSLRRKRPTVGDIDILASSLQPAAVTKAFVSMPFVKKVLAVGPTKGSVILENGMQSDLRVVLPGQWGSALLYFTGSKAHSIALRKIAIKKGLKVNEYGVFRGNKLVAGRTEQEIYNLLGMDYIPPEQRENEGEIEAAIKRFGKKESIK